MEPNFAEAPRSFTEMKADKTGRAEDWTCRDALISMLRDIDRGVLDPDNIIITYSLPGDEEHASSVHTVLGGRAEWLQRLGMLEASKMMVI